MQQRAMVCDHTPAAPRLWRHPFFSRCQAVLGARLNMPRLAGRGRGMAMGRIRARRARQAVLTGADYTRTRDSEEEGRKDCTARCCQESGESGTGLLPRSGFGGQV